MIALVGYTGFVGSNIYAAAVGQDKVFMKQILESSGIPVVDYMWFTIDDYRNSKEEIFKKIEKLDYPLIIEPSSLGSSVGIEVVRRK